MSFRNKLGSHLVDGTTDNQTYIKEITANQ